MAFKRFEENTTGLNYEVIEKYGVLNPSGKAPKELRLVKWNGKAPKYDLRPWTQNEDGSETPNKGITLDADELTQLYEILKGMDSDDMEEIEESEG